MKTRTKLIGLTAVLTIGTATLSFNALSQDAGHGAGPHAMQRPMMGQGMGHGMMGQRMMGHGMRGPGMMMGGGMMGHDPATFSQVQAIHRLLAEHQHIRRTVTNLPNGIRTVTESDVPEVAELIKSHLAEMGKLVAQGTAAGLPMQSPALSRLIRAKDKVRTSVEQTTAGVIVTQTSDDASVVADLQEHAVQVSDLVRGGMPALHASMMRNMGGMHGGMGHGGMMPGGMQRGAGPAEMHRH